ncbi:hypothetical protein PROFUN_16454, partial [Planoprotostelium fungivorum]
LVTFHKPKLRNLQPAACCDFSRYTRCTRSWDTSKTRVLIYAGRRCTRNDLARDQFPAQKLKPTSQATRNVALELAGNRILKKSDDCWLLPMWKT